MPSTRTFVLRYAVAAVAMLVLDAVWLVAIASPLYESALGDALAEEPNLVAGGVFYLLYVAGLVHFGIAPARGSWRRAAASGGFLGLVAYGTWALTNAAVLTDWPLALVPVDMAWGALLSGATCALTVVVTGRLAEPGGHDRAQSSRR